MTGTERQIQAQIDALLKAEGRDLTIEYASTGAYDTETGTVANTPASVVVRGKLYQKRIREQVAGSAGFATRTIQKIVVAAANLTKPTNADYIVDGDDRYAILEVMPQGDPALTYELVIEKG